MERELAIWGLISYTPSLLCLPLSFLLTTASRSACCALVLEVSSNCIAKIIQVMTFVEQPMLMDVSFNSIIDTPSNLVERSFRGLFLLKFPLLYYEPCNQTKITTADGLGKLESEPNGKIWEGNTWN